MPDKVEARVRAPDAYALAQRVLDAMQHDRVWPTPLNYELWLNMLAEPEGALAREIRRLLADEETITDEKGGTAMITTADVFQSNGVIHVIDSVLMPS